MAASPADQVIARAFGGVVIASDTALGPTSYDETGQRFVFLSAPQDQAIYALDIEATGTEMHPSVLDRLKAHSQSEAWRLWTELEVRAKLLDIPVLALLRKGPAWRADDFAMARADTKLYQIAIGKQLSLTASRGNKRVQKYETEL